MSKPLPEDSAARPAAGRCAECTASLAPDQRYCIACGARRGPLPLAIAQLIGTAPPSPGRAVAREETGVPMPGSRSAAVAVMGLLAFGVLVGSLVSPTAQSTASAPVVVALMPTASSAVAPAAPISAAGVPADSFADTGSTPVAATAPAVAPQATVPAAAPPPAAPVLPPVKHVFLIVLSDHSLDEAYGPGSPAPYLATTLRAQGELLADYYAVTQGELANDIALTSGQGPTVQTAADCPQYADIAPGTVGAGGQVAGDGCDYPIQAHTVADQLATANKTWKAYVEAAGDTPAPTTTPAPAPTCPVPAPGATSRNPFLYFHSIVDNADSCAQNDVGLDQLATDLKFATATPALSYIVPNSCHDGTEQPCAADQPAGLAAADGFLRTVVPEIEASPAYKDGGLIAITFDQAPQTGPDADSTACCDPQLFANLPQGAAPMPTVTAPLPADVAPLPTVTDAAPAPVDATPAPTVTDAAAAPATLRTAPPAAPDLSPLPRPPAPIPADGTPTSPGGGRVGLLLISPFVKPGSMNQTDSYNHFSLLRGIEDLFGLDHLGYAADPALPAFDKAVYTAHPKKP